MSGRVRFCLMLAALLGATRNAAGAPCFALRPTSPEADWSYAGAKTATFDTPQGNVRIWYTTEGKHAPAGLVNGAVPASVSEAGAAAETALARYTELGFREPVSDATSPCTDNGGDARLDVYLFDFNSADGTILVDGCSEQQPAVCSGFALVENDFASAYYASAAQGFRTVVPHELFHLVQQAYSDNGEAWWSEGTAQWATQQVYPELSDLERLLPAFFQRTERPLDLPPVGAAAGFSYGAAIWPVFLSEHVDATLPRQVFEALAGGATSVLGAADSALTFHGGLSARFAEFTRWNLATGKRAGAAGYTKAEQYPEVQLQELGAALAGEVSGKLAGLSARYFASPGGALRRIDLAGDARRVGGWFVPLVAGAAQLEQATELPFVGDAAGVVVVNGRALDHRDVAFELSWAAPDVPPADEAAGDQGGAGAVEPGAPTAPGAAGQASGGEGDVPPAAGQDFGGTGATASPLAGSAADEEPSAAPERASRTNDGGCSLSARRPGSRDDCWKLLLVVGVVSAVRRSAARSSANRRTP